MILPDADRPGRAHAQKVAKAIHGVAASVRILDLYPERYDGSDVSDFIADDTAGVRLVRLANDAPLWGPSGPTTSAGVAANGAELLTDVDAFLRRFVAYPSDHAHVAHTLWIAHAHAMEAWDSTPRIAFLSPEPGSGKTRALEVSEILVPNPVEAVNVTPAYLFRKVGSEEGAPTILFDEVDTIFGPKAKDNEEIRGLLNAGHRRGAVAGRCVVRGKTVETEEIPAYCAVALAGLGWLPDTLMSRAIVIRIAAMAAPIILGRCRELRICRCCLVSALRLPARISVLPLAMRSMATAMVTLIGGRCFTRTRTPMCRRCFIKSIWARAPISIACKFSAGPTPIKASSAQ